MSISGRASWSTSTSRSSVVSTAVPVTGSPANDGTPAGAQTRPGSAGSRSAGNVHIAIDDCTRLAYAEVLPNEKATTVVGFLRRAVAFYMRHGITVERLLTDNGSGYRSAIHAIACRALGIRHLRTRPYRPQTNGTAERLIRTLLAGRAYGAIYRTSSERTAALDGWLWHYNHQRRHSALGHKPPIARLNERTNLLGTYN
jgi:transposase InsO family protein